jgi:hypothetical protein
MRLIESTLQIELPLQQVGQFARISPAVRLRPINTELHFGALTLEPDVSKGVRAVVRPQDRRGGLRGNCRDQLGFLST